MRESIITLFIAGIAFTMPSDLKFSGRARSDVNKVASQTKGVFTTINHGTLDVVLATPRFIVVATDSRRTSDGGVYQDNSKKLFTVGKKRILAIAGLADTSISRIPWLSAQVAPLLDVEIARSQPWISNDDYYWNDPLPPEGLPERFRDGWNNSPYYWWTSVLGPIQTILNIALSYGDLDPNRFRLEGLLAGFKDTGEAKIERLVLIPKKGLSNWGRPYIAATRVRERTVTRGSLIWKTAGVNQLANIVLAGTITTELRGIASKYPGISAFLDRRETNSVDGISETEMIALAKDLIRATAELTPTVGSAPIQVATVKPNQEATIEQPTFPAPSIFLPSEGTWHLGVAFTPDYPFDQRNKNVVYTFCEIKDNDIPIPLGDNHFYGNTLERATFIYRGGRISFDQNKVNDSKLIIVSGVDEAPVAQLLKYFKEIIKQAESQVLQ